MNNIIRTMVNGFFAGVTLAAQSYIAFYHEFISLTHRALNEDKDNYNFVEIYNPNSGKPDGDY